MLSTTAQAGLPCRGADVGIQQQALFTAKCSRHRSTNLVGPATLWNLPAARVVLPADTTEDGDGLLPLSLFTRVSFRHHEGYMVVQPR